MRFNPAKTDTVTSRVIAISLVAITTISLLCFIHAPTIPRKQSTPRFQLPRASETVESTRSPNLPAVSTNWTIKHHGECCEGNLAAEGPSTYLLLPVLVTGNKILRSDDNGVTFVKKYPPVDASVPYGIEGDLQAFGNDIDFFGTLVVQGVSAHSTDRGETWTVVPIPVAFAANDQSWSYLGPFSGLTPAQTAPYVLAGWFRIGSVALFSFDGGLTWPIQTPLVGDDGSGSMHIVCQQSAHAPTSPGDTRNPNALFHNHKAGHYGCWGTDRLFYWTEPSPPDLYVCKTDNFGVTWTGIRHPISPGPGSSYVTSHSGFDDKGTFYLLHGDKLYVSFNQGESFAFVHTLPHYGNAGLSDSGADHFFVVNCGTIHVGIAEAGPGGNTNIWYLRGTHVDTASPTWDQELVDVVGNNRLDFFQIVLNGNNIPTLSYTAPGTEVTTASRDSALPPSDTCSHVDPFVSAVSRKIHGDAGTFDILLPLSPTAPGIECRSGGANGDHDIVICFASPVTIGSVTASCGSVSGAPVFSGNCATIHLTGVQNPSRCTVTLNNVSDGVATASIPVPVDFILGDTSANDTVNSTDVSQTKAQSGTVPSAASFRTDVTVNGLINSSDVSTVKLKSGTALP